MRPILPALCAERVLLFNTGANYPNKQIKTLAVLAIKNEKVIAATPCGACRQVMVEYEQKQENHHSHNYV